MIYISSDHRGFDLKNYLVETFKNEGVEIKDLGPKELEGEDDFVDFATMLANKIQEDTDNQGILLCKNGVGMSMAANRFRGIRAALSWNPDHAASSRNDDNSNVLVLPSNYLSKNDALEIVRGWLNTPFSGEERFVRRLSKLDLL
jgi:ribose 5-phosphate isomerase B